MKNLIFLCLTFVFLLFFNSSCKDDEKVLPACTADIEWEYEGNEGPDHWEELCVDYVSCAGQSQSPVNLSSPVDDASLAQLAISYKASTTHIVNKGHTIQFPYDGGSTVTVNGATYELLQFHTHTHSEHSVNGKHADMEIHFVHKNTASGNLVVIGVLVEEGAENAMLKEFTEHLPASKDATYDNGATFSATALMPASKAYFTYSGSLTTPPCSEIVTWFVMEQPVTASAEQIDAFEHLEHENARPLQSLGGRTIRRFKG